MIRQRAVRIILPVLLLALLAASAGAAILPSFHIETCAWNATDIVVASEGETIDGKLTVLEVCVGSLTAGETVHLPELAEFASVAARQEDEFFRERGSRVTVTGSRMILFLRRATPGTDPRQAWAPAPSWGGMDVSICWIEAGQAYARQQIMNPGPAVLTRLQKSEEELRARTREVRSEKTALAKVRAIDDVAKRIEAAVPLTELTSAFAREEAVAILRDSGVPAVPHLLALALPDRHDGDDRVQWVAMEALEKVGDPSAVPPLVQLLEQELVFWKDAGPRLVKGWWNGEGLAPDEVENYRGHYSRVFSSLRVLAAIGAPGYEDVVHRTRALWRRQPALYAIAGGQIVAMCDTALAALEALDPDEDPPEDPDPE